MTDRIELNAQLPMADPSSHSRSGEDIWALAVSKLSQDEQQAIGTIHGRKLEAVANLLVIVKESERICVSKQWRYKRKSGEVVILRDLFGKLVKWIQRFKDIGDTAIQYDPVHAALPWAGVRFLLEVAVSDIERFGFMVEGAEMIAYNIDRYAIIEEICLRSGSIITAKLQDRLTALYAQILRYLIKAKKYFESKTGSRMLKASIISKAELESFSSSVFSAQKHVDDYVALVNAERSKDLGLGMEKLALDQKSSSKKFEDLLRDIEGPIHRGIDQLESFKDHLKLDERTAILLWISPEPYLEHHMQNIKDVLQGTGQWLLEEPLFRNWKRDSASSLFWLHGTSGSGKTKLVSLVIEEFMEQNHKGLSVPPVFFYCSRNSQEPRRSEPQVILASLARQLSSVGPGDQLLPPATRLYQERKRSGFALGSLSIEESTRLIIDLTAYYPATTIILDALDECKFESRHLLLDSLQDILSQSRSLVKIFASSRDEGDLVCELSEYPSIRVSANKNSDDIAVYVRIETQKLVTRRRLLRFSDRKDVVQDLIVKRLIEDAHGMFRWVSLQLDALCALNTDSDILNRLGRLPRKLADLYLETYNNMLARNYEAGQRLILNTFHWLMCAEKPKPDFFLAAISQQVPEVPTKDQLLDLCCNFIIYDQDSNIFRFTHLSVQEFLETLPSFSTEVSHAVAAECCLASIMKRAESPRVRTFLADHYHLHDYKGIMAKEHLGCWSFEDYALTRGMWHCKEAGVERLRGSLQTFFHMFFLDEIGVFSPLYAYIDWLPDGVIDLELRRELHRLEKEAVSKPENSVHCALLIACAFGFAEIIPPCLRTPLPAEIIAKGLLCANHYKHRDVTAEFKIKSHIVLTTDVLRHALRDLKVEAVECGQLLPVLADDGSTVPMTKEVALWACHSYDRMALLMFCRIRSLDERRMLVAAAASKPDGVVLRLLLKDNDTSDIDEGVIKSAATPENLHILLQHAQSITQSFLKSALRNRFFDKSCLELLESRVGRLRATLDILEAAAAWKDSRAWKEVLLRRGAQVTEDSIILVAKRHGENNHETAVTWKDPWDRDVAQITEDSLTVATQHGNEKSHQATSMLALHLKKKTTAVQISQELVERVMDLDCAVSVMTVLLKHLAPTFKVTEHMMQRAMYLCRKKTRKFIPLLLAQDPTFQITESLIESAISDPLYARRFLTSLLSHDPSFRISEYLVQLAVLVDSTQMEDSTPKEPIETILDTGGNPVALKPLLDHDPHLRITFDLFEELQKCRRLSGKTVDLLFDRLGPETGM